MRAVPASRYLVFFSIVVVGCLIDLATKSWAFDRLRMPLAQPTWWLWEDVVGFQTSLNQGALFGLGQGWVVALVVLSIAAALGILAWLFLAHAARDLLLTVTLGCLMAGILGNLYDRLGLHGLTWDRANALRTGHNVGDPVYAVRDFILVMIGNWPWPTFNIADSLLVCGAGLLILHWMRQDAGDQPSAVSGR